MAERKTHRNDGDVEAFLNSVEDERRRADAFTVLEMIRRITGEEPMMWGHAIIGFGNYHYKYDSGREGDWFVAGFSPRKQALSLYIMGGLKRHDEILKRLGKFKLGKSCLYVKKLDDVDMEVLEELVSQSVRHVSGGNA